MDRYPVGKATDLNPDLVLIEYGGNDCDYKWDEVARRPEMACTCPILL